MAWKPIKLGPFTLESVQLTSKLREPSLEAVEDALNFLLDLERRNPFYAWASGTSCLRSSPDPPRLPPM